MEKHKKAIFEILSQLIEPKLKWTIGVLNLIKRLEINDQVLELEIQLITDDIELINQFREQVFQVLIEFQFSEINLNISKANIAKQGLKKVSKIIMVSSGKGGVGKSSISVNLAAMLKSRGHTVGLLDADIYGPSVPILMGITEKPQVLDDEVLAPIMAHGIATISIGNLVPPGQAISWRGQLVSGTIIQFIRKVNWGVLDYLIIDMPPGTGDIQLTIARELKITGVIIVSMPQEVVIGDVQRSISLYREKKVNLIGVIQNMVSYACEKCGHQQQIFPGSLNKIPDVPGLGSLILDTDFCEAGNIGVPFVLSRSSGKIFDSFQRMAEKLELL
ncbi:MAG: Mrp/NBP35 family ATP-binding protein [Deltaproteobacteria bacterium]|jgi:ATP-binding protein involved in chromosome partitioning|nr:Mrp/NBP35 family ATP-binding protein [Deltaproteobacteria bacterium]MBT4526195.1 Mrp/NBP35 family ATP-binding protein [Deltaproteobacteria bacterium]